VPQLQLQLQLPLVGLDRYRAAARYPIPDTIGRIYTDTDSDTDTGLYKFFCSENVILCGV